MEPSWWLLFVLEEDPTKGSVLGAAGGVTSTDDAVMPRAHIKLRNDFTAVSMVGRSCASSADILASSGVTVVVVDDDDDGARAAIRKFDW
jgi:hypothetical protein